MKSDKPTAGNHGFSLIELLIVVVIMGILATLVTFAVGGIRDEADEVACDGDARILATSIEGYFALAPATAIPGTDDPDDREQALINLELLRNPSTLYEVNEDGTLELAMGSPCTL